MTRETRFRPKSLPGAIFARELLAELPECGSGGIVTENGLSWGVRRASRGHVWGDQTGGLVITVRARRPRYGGDYYQRTRRLGPGWTQEQALQAIDTLYTHTLREYNQSLLEAREALMDRFDAARLTQDDIDVILAEAEKTGRPTDYSLMTAADCIIWANWLKGYLIERERRG